MLKTFARRLSRRLGNVLKLLSSEDVDDSILDKEKNLYKRGIIKAAREFALFDEEVTSGSELADAIARIGYLAYAGGPPATKSAGAYLPNFTEVLGKTDVREDLKVAILKTISIVTVNHAEHQDQCANLGLVRIVADIICQSSESVLSWAIYCMHNMIVGNIRNMQMLVEENPIQTPLEEAVLLDWTGFQNNYATSLLKLLGIERQIDIGAEKKEQDADTARDTEQDNVEHSTSEETETPVPTEEE